MDVLKTGVRFLALASSVILATNGALAQSLELQKSCDTCITPISDITGELIPATPEAKEATETKPAHHEADLSPITDLKAAPTSPEADKQAPAETKPVPAGPSILSELDAIPAEDHAAAPLAQPSSPAFQAELPAQPIELEFAMNPEIETDANATAAPAVLPELKPSAPAPQASSANIKPVKATPKDMPLLTAPVAKAATAKPAAKAQAAKPAKAQPKTQPTKAAQTAKVKPVAQPQLEPMLPQQAMQPELPPEALMLDPDTPAFPVDEALPPEDTTAEAIGPAAPDAPAVDNNPAQASDKKKNTKPVSYSPVSAIAIFPVIKTGSERAFSDLPVLFARELANDLEHKAPQTKVLNPVYTVDELRLRGLGHVYDKIMKYYVTSGRPEPAAMDYMLKQLSTEDRPITRVIFVEADLDFSRPAKATTPWDISKQFLTDAQPKRMKYFVRSRLQVFDTENPTMPMAWGWSWDRSIPVDRSGNVTPSVFQDSDSQMAFSRLSREMNREIFIAMDRFGKKAYLDAQYDTSVTGQLSQQPPVSPFPNLTDTQGGRVTTENRQAIQRILQRQNQQGAP